MRLSRRDFLVASGWVAGGVTVLSSCSLVPVLPTFGSVGEDDGVTWIQLRADGSVLFRCPRAEMGQGIATGLSRVVADELGLPQGGVECVYPTTSEIAPVPMTVGSQSVEQFYEPTARAAASLRELLAERAVARTGRARSELDLEDGAFVARGGERIGFAELLEPGESTIAPASADPDLVLSSRVGLEARAAGETTDSLVHADRLVRGTEVFSRDVRLDGMAFGAVAHPPQLGAQLLGFDADTARGVPGVVAVVTGPAGEVGVVAETPMAARAGAEALACRWAPLDDAQLAEVQAPLDVDRAIADGGLDHTPFDEGDLGEGRERAVHHLDARYDTPMVAHAALEPRSGVADVRDGRCEVHTGSQDPWFVQGHVARALGLSRGRVVVHNHRIGGAFGGRALCQAAVEAAWLSAGAGRPVKVQWTREDEFAHNYVGPQFSHRIQAGTDEEGEIAYWHHRMVGGPILTSSALVPENLHWAADIPPDPGTFRGTDLPYRAPSRRVDFADVRQPMPTGAWRGLGAAPNTFAVECAIDELARGAGADPLDFRLSRAGDDRLARVLERVRVLSEWEQARGDGRHFGVAAAAYKNVTFVAVVAEIADPATPRVTGLWCVHDCGYVMSPDRVRAQVEGNLAWGVGMALHEEFRLVGGTAGTRNFDTYAIARNADLPRTEIELIDSPEDPSGAGEAAFAPAAAAIVNAVSAARGEPVRRLPLREAG